MNRIIKYASLLMAAVMLISCGGTVDNGGGSTGAKTLKLVADKNLIQTFGGDYATLTVTLDGEVVTEGVTFFDGKNNVLTISDFKFSTDKIGEYKIWANVGTYNSETITIKAIDIAIPDTPADPKPESTDFKARVLLTEFTTTGCSACPAMKTILHDLEADKAVCEKVVFTECHSGLIGGVADPCYLHNQSFEDFCMINGYPTVKFDLTTTLVDRAGIKSAINEIHAAKAESAPGIAVNANLENDKVVAKVTVKAKVASSYRVGAFLVEDGVSAKYAYATADWMNTSNNVIRYVDASYKGSFYGIPVADIKAGETADTMISWILEDIWAYGTERGEINGGIAWPARNNDKLHMIVFVSMSDGFGGYQIVNAIDCPINGVTPFEYK
jgi:thiol-disulfide isomerase/thioredoxin